MANQGDLLADAAVRLIGTRFRLHGRNVETGLDCVGLVVSSLQAMGRKAIAPEGYQLRNRSFDRWLIFAQHCGLSPVKGPLQRGDVLLVGPGPTQQHLLIVDSPKTAVHAHAGLRRVVRQPYQFPRKPLAHWRLH